MGANWRQNLTLKNRIEHWLFRRVMKLQFCNFAFVLLTQEVIVSCFVLQKDIAEVFWMDSAWQRGESMHRWILENGGVFHFISFHSFIVMTIQTSLFPVFFPDKRTDPWLLVYSPVPIICIFLCYLGVVWMGPKLMKHKEPVNLKPVLIVYNFSMVGLSVYMFHEVRNCHYLIIQFNTLW